MGRGLAVVALALVGLLCAAGMGFAAYVVSRGSVAVPVTKLQRAPAGLTPAVVRERARPKKPPTRTSTSTRTTTTVAPPPPPTTTRVDHGGSGRGGGGHGEDD